MKTWFITGVSRGLGFRTDFLSAHSLRRSEAAAAGYEDSVGRMGAAFDAMAGRQLGDPARAAAALLQLVDSEDAPTQLLLGSDALKRAREKLATTLADMDRWEPLTLGTDHPRRRLSAADTHLEFREIDMAHTDQEAGNLKLVEQALQAAAADVSNFGERLFAEDAEWTITGHA